MRIFVGVGLLFLVGISTTPLRAQVIYTLMSPNEVTDGGFGYSVAGLGDVNGDGRADLAVGACDEGSSMYRQGRVYVFSGANGDILHVLVSPYEEILGRFGMSLHGGGNFDGDGIGDLLIGAPYEDPGSSPNDAGRAYAFSGSYGAPIRTYSSPNEEAYGQFGISVSAVEDLNGDGRDETLVGADKETVGDQVHAGRAYLFSNATGAVLFSFSSPNVQQSGYFGYAVAGIGDVDGDGKADMVVGAYREGPSPSPSAAGRAYVFSGATGQLLYSLASPNEDVNGQFGHSVASAGDVTGDGCDDIIVGASGESRAYVFDGATGLVARTLTCPNWEPDAQFGWAVSGAGDVNGDGHGEMIVGARYHDPGGSPSNAGRAYVFDGASGLPFCYLVSPPDEENGLFGYAVSGGTDVNGDGHKNIIVGASGEAPGTSPSGAGRAYVFSPYIGLTGGISEDQLILQWSACPGAEAYWLYGAENEAYFVPGFFPGYDHRIAVLDTIVHTWSDTTGVGDPSRNWTYLVMAMGSAGLEVYRSNRFGEWDFLGDIP